MSIIIGLFGVLHPTAEYRHLLTYIRHRAACKFEPTFEHTNDDIHRAMPSFLNPSMGRKYTTKDVSATYLVCMFVVSAMYVRGIGFDRF